MAQVLFNGKTKEREDLLTVSCGFVKEHSAQREEALLENGECGGAAWEPLLSRQRPLLRRSRRLQGVRKAGWRHKNLSCSRSWNAERATSNLWV